MANTTFWLYGSWGSHPPLLPFNTVPIHDAIEHLLLRYLQWALRKNDILRMNGLGNIKLSSYLSAIEAKGMRALALMANEEVMREAWLGIILHRGWRYWRECLVGLLVIPLLNPFWTDERKYVKENQSWCSKVYIAHIATYQQELPSANIVRGRRHTVGNYWAWGHDLSSWARSRYCTIERGRQPEGYLMCDAWQKSSW